MSRYTFTVRKRECEISLSTDDRNAIEQQIAIWVMALSRKPLLESVPPEAVPFVPERFEAQEESAEIPPEPEAVVSEETFVAEEEPSDTVVEVQEEQPEIKPFEPERIETPQEENVQEYVEEFINTVEPEEILPANVQFVAPEVKPEPANKELAVTLNSLFNAESPTSVDFESILEKSVDNLAEDSSNVIKKDEIFCKLVKANNITDRLELLLFTADYFCKYDARFVFSLKQINGKLMHNLAVIVDHGILKIALDNNYLERVGDSEYKLTEYGRSEIYSKAGIWS